MGNSSTTTLLPRLRPVAEQALAQGHLWALERSTSMKPGSRGFSASTSLQTPPPQASSLRPLTANLLRDEFKLRPFRGVAGIVVQVIVLTETAGASPTDAVPQCLLLFHTIRISPILSTSPKSGGMQPGLQCHSTSSVIDYGRDRKNAAPALQWHLGPRSARDISYRHFDHDEGGCSLFSPGKRAVAAHRLCSCVTKLHSL